MKDNENSVLPRLTAPFKPEQVKWRATLSGLKDGKPWVMVAPYLDARTIQNRLDEILGAMNWSAKYRQGPGSGILCTLSIRINGEWIDKCDAASLTEIEPVKGGISNAFRRASVAWGIGRYLYNVGNLYGFVTEHGQYKASAKNKSTGEWTNFRFQAPKLEGTTQPESKTTTGRDMPPQRNTAPVPPKREEAARREPTYEELPVSLKQIFEDVKIGKTKALEMCRRKSFDFVEVERIIRDLLPELEKPAAA